MFGRCVISDGEFRVEKSASGMIHSAYVESKIYFLTMSAVILWAVISVVVDAGIFARALALPLLLMGIALGVVIGLAEYSGLGSRGLSSTSSVPLDSLQSVVVSRSSMADKLLVNYSEEGAEKSLLIQLPISWFSFTDTSLEESKAVFEQLGVPVHEDH